MPYELMKRIIAYRMQQIAESHTTKKKIKKEPQ